MVPITPLRLVPIQRYRHHLSILLLVTFIFGCKDTPFSRNLQYLKMMVSQKYLNMGIDKKF